MYRMNPDCWLWSPRPHLCLHPQHSGAVLRLQEDQEEDEEEEEESGEHPAVCCYAAGCDGVISQAVDAQWSASEPPTHSGIPSCSALAGRGPAARAEQPKTVIEADGGDVSRHFIGGHRWEGPGMETRACVCDYGQREPEGLSPCWPGSPYIYYGVRRNVVIGVEVVEEVAVEDTLEVITEDIYTDDLLLQDPQLYPT